MRVNWYDLARGEWNQTPMDSLGDRIVEQLQAGFVVAMATDTVFGFCAWAEHEKAVSRIAVIKGREQSMVPPVLVPSLAYALGYAQPLVHGRLARAIKTAGSAPVSFVVPVISWLARATGSLDQTVAIRVARGDALLGKVLDQIPVAASSANLHGMPTPSSAKEILRQLSSVGSSEVLYSMGLSMIVDGEASSIASTVVRLYPIVEVIRKGAIGEDVLEAVLRC